MPPRPLDVTRSQTAVPALQRSHPAGSSRFCKAWPDAAPLPHRGAAVTDCGAVAACASPSLPVFFRSRWKHPAEQCWPWHMGSQAWMRPAPQLSRRAARQGSWFLQCGVQHLCQSLQAKHGVTIWHSIWQLVRSRAWTVLGRRAHCIRAPGPRAPVVNMNLTNMTSRHGRVQATPLPNSISGILRT